ncbi:MAG: VWA domain-containing protein [Candidatus Eisenbacteria bacterium]
MTSPPAVRTILSLDAELDQLGARAGQRCRSLTGNQSGELIPPGKGDRHEMATRTRTRWSLDRSVHPGRTGLALEFGTERIRRSFGPARSGREGRRFLELRSRRRGWGSVRHHVVALDSDAECVRTSRSIAGVLAHTDEDHRPRQLRDRPARAHRTGPSAARPGPRHRPFGIDVGSRQSHTRSEAAYRLVDAMAPSDVLGVVEYDDEISVLWPASRLTSPDAVKRLISHLEPRGSTNLAGGLFRGIDEVNRHATHGGINRVFLFSDGLANHGITSPREIAAYVREARSHGITVSTLGLGLDYNEDLMQTIAEAGGGNYYFVESPAQMHRSSSAGSTPSSRP